MIESTLLPLFAPVLRYPGADQGERLARLRSRVARECPRAVPAVDAFVAETREWPLRRHEEAFTRTFDLEPQCSPYLGVHLFGEHNALRSQLLTGLAATFAEAALDDLPDHLAVVLENWPLLSGEEQRDLLDHCLRKALASMIGQLRVCANPYRHLIEAVQAAIEPAHPDLQPQEVARA